MSFPLGEILFLVFLTFLEGFFVAAEIALVSVRRSRIDQLVEEGRASARRVRRLIDDPGRFLAVAQIGLTMIGFFASAFAAVSLVDRLQSLLESFGMNPGAAGGTALVVVTIILALFTIIFAELIPKSIALASPERFALVLARPIDWLARALGPLLIALFNPPPDRQARELIRVFFTASHVMVSIVVVFPAPLRPTSTTASPLPTRNDTPRST